MAKLPPAVNVKRSAGSVLKGAALILLVISMLFQQIPATISLCLQTGMLSVAWNSTAKHVCQQCPFCEARAATEHSCCKQRQATDSDGTHRVDRAPSSPCCELAAKSLADTIIPPTTDVHKLTPVAFVESSEFAPIDHWTRARHGQDHSAFPRSIDRIISYAHFLI